MEYEPEFPVYSSDGNIKAWLGLDVVPDGHVDMIQ